MKEQHGPLMEDQSNARFGNYDLIRPIDTGGMGEVYLAHQRSAFGRPVAIKIIRSDLVHDMTARARFLREAEVSAHLKHEHILPLFEFGEDQGRLFLVTPYIDGGTLARRLKSGSLSLYEVRQLFVPLVQAVAYIHRRGVVHRDLKPTNILLDEQDGQIYVRLIDFGIAMVQGHTASPPLTTAGNEVGTIAYMAPERLNGIAAPCNDIFSLGVILHQMLTGNLPMGDELDPLSSAMEYVVRRCIAANPEDRFATADEVLKNFERAYQTLSSPPQRLPGLPTAPIPALVPLDPALTGGVSQNPTAEMGRRETV
ncbi:MAG TPA: serine/threonine-protein kinase, partial [Ktedonobacteraceae bacterium]